MKRPTPLQWIGILFSPLIVLIYTVLTVIERSYICEMFSDFFRVYRNFFKYFVLSYFYPTCGWYQWLGAEKHGIGWKCRVRWHYRQPKHPSWANRTASIIEYS